LRYYNFTHIQLKNNKVKPQRDYLFAQAWNVREKNQQFNPQEIFTEFFQQKKYFLNLEVCCLVSYIGLVKFEREY